MSERIYTEDQMKAVKYDCEKKIVRVTQRKAILTAIETVMNWNDGGKDDRGEDGIIGGETLATLLLDLTQMFDGHWEPTGNDLIREVRDLRKQNDDLKLKNEQILANGGSDIDWSMPKED